jgi:OST3 / OST6 family, transporter family
MQFQARRLKRLICKKCNLNLLSGLTVDPLAAILRRDLKITLTLSRPIDYTPMIYTAAGLVAAIVLLRVALAPIKRIVGKQDMWLFFCMVLFILRQFFTIIMCTGFMWCNIRSPPMVGNNNGQPSYIAEGFQNQNGAEIYIIGALCILC